MPVYAASSNPTALYPGDSLASFNNESIAANTTAGQQAALSEGWLDGYQAVSMEVTFDGAPGAFSLTLQVADKDADGSYVAALTAITAVNSGNSAAVSGQVKALFARAFFTTKPENAVKATVTITR